jgi:hypothetical protein
VNTDFDPFEFVIGAMLILGTLASIYYILTAMGVDFTPAWALSSDLFSYIPI